MLFSVIVPIYKVEKYLRQCIESVLNQTCKDFELILVDDGSPDKCPQICDEYAMQDQRIKVIHKENGGLVSARKAGARIAQGKYVACLDGDDYLAVDFLESFSKIIERFSPDIIVGGFIKAYSNIFKNIPCVVQYRKGYYTKNDIVKEIFPSLIKDCYGKSFSPNLWAKVYKLDLYKDIQLSVNDKMKIGEDGAVTIPMVYRANSLYVDTATGYYYRQNQNSMTKAKSIFNMSEPCLYAKHVMYYIDMQEQDFQKQLYRAIVHSLFNRIVSQFNRQAKYGIIKKEIRERIHQESLYVEAIKNACFKNIKERLMLWVLRNHCFWLMKIYNRIK